MSASDTSSSRTDSTLNDRAAAVRATMAEIRLAKAEPFRKEAHEKATKYHMLPTAAAANRALIAGTVVNIENCADSGTYWKAEFINGNGDSLFVYAGDNDGHHGNAAPKAFFGNQSPPFFAAALCKLDFIDDPDENPLPDRRVALRPEVVTEISRDRRDQILVENALATIDRATSEGNPQLEARVDEKYAGVDERFDRIDFSQQALDVIEAIDSQRR